MRLTPRDTRFYDLFAGQAQHLVRGADLLAELVEARPERRPPLAEAMRDTEHDADETFNSVYAHGIKDELSASALAAFNLGITELRRLIATRRAALTG